MRYFIVDAEILGFSKDFSNTKRCLSHFQALFEKSDFHKSFHIPDNYRIFTFGKSHKYMVQVDDAEYWSSHKRYFYDEFWQFQPFSYNMPVLTDDIKKPKHLKLMLTIAYLLAYDCGFVRVDLYDVADKVYVGELTLTPVGGSGRFTPQEWDKKLGDLWEIKP